VRKRADISKREKIATSYYPSSSIPFSFAMSNVTISPDELPPSLRLPPHLSAHKYFFVCTLTVAAWDTLVLSPRSWKLLKQDGWPALKSIFFFLRILMPTEFVIVGVSQSCRPVPYQLTWFTVKVLLSLTLVGRDRWVQSSLDHSVMYAQLSSGMSTVLPL
jgi:hypothetical protein